MVERIIETGISPEPRLCDKRDAGRTVKHRSRQQCRALSRRRLRAAECVQAVAALRGFELAEGFDHGIETREVITTAREQREEMRHFVVIGGQRGEFGIVELAVHPGVVAAVAAPFKLQESIALAQLGIQRLFGRAFLNHAMFSRVGARQALAEIAQQGDELRFAGLAGEITGEGRRVVGQPARHTGTRVRRPPSQNFH